MNARPVFDTVRPWLDAQGFTPERIAALDAAIAAMHAEPCRTLTARIVLEVVEHEAIVREAYKDSEGFWTWAVGVTSRSGHNVERYKDNPQPLRRCLGVSIWLMRERYLPHVLRAFGDTPLTEAQLAAALSFNYNTGAIGRAGWVASFKAGDIAAARARFMEWRQPASIIARREKERDLFFDGSWSQSGTAVVLEVAKPSYAPRWSSAKRVDVAADVAAILGATA